MSRTAGGRNAEWRGDSVGMTEVGVFLAEAHQCLGTKPSSLLHKPASSLPIGVRASGY